MQAVVARQFGGPEVLELHDRPEPAAGPGEVLVKVEAVDVIGLDTAIRAGLGEVFGISPPYVTGDGLAGTVAEVGDGVDPAWRERRVAVATGAQGAAAEVVRASVASLVPVPDGLSLDHAAAVVHDGRTARALFEAAQLRTGERVLVMPAASGLGLVLIQLACSAGAEVLAVAGGPAKLAVARNYGAEILLDHTTSGWEARVAEVDVVFDGVGGEAARLTFGAVRRGGRFLSYGDTSGSYADLSTPESEARVIRLHGPEVVHLGGSAETQDLTRQAFADAVEGRVRPLVAGRHAWDRAGDAHRAQEARSGVGRQLLVRST